MAASKQNSAGIEAWAFMTTVWRARIARSVSNASAGRRLQLLARREAGDASLRELPQVVVDQRHEHVRGAGFAVRQLLEDLRDGRAIGLRRSAASQGGRHCNWLQLALVSAARAPRNWLRGDRP